MRNSSDVDVRPLLCLSASLQVLADLLCANVMASLTSRAISCLVLNVSDLQPLVCQGGSSAWAAERVRQEPPFAELFDAVARANAGMPVMFTGEMIFPWMFDEVRRGFHRLTCQTRPSLRLLTPCKAEPATSCYIQQWTLGVASVYHDVKAPLTERGLHCAGGITAGYEAGCGALGCKSRLASTIQLRAAA